MRRLVTAAALALLAIPARADERLPLREALALQMAVQEAIDRTEPAIASVAVSRSNGYRELAALTGKQPTTDVPGKLGEFDASLARTLLKAVTDESRKQALGRLINALDLADSYTVPEFYGSGVVIDAAEGLVLTNWHVVRDATRVYVRLPGKPGSYADIHAADARSDLAVLRLIRRPPGLKAIAFGDGERVKKGTFVVALANPFAVGLADGSPSASWGIVSNLRRRAPGTVRPSTDVMQEPRPLQEHTTLIQTDARLNLGCSGGALVDLRGELVGLTTSLAAIQGGDTAGGYAVPMTAPMRRIVDILKRGEEMEYGLLGVTFSSMDLSPPPEGIRIGTPAANGPAAKAGVQAGDVLLAVNGMPIRDADDLFLAVGTLAAGSDATLTVQTGPREPRELKATLAKLFHKHTVLASRRPDPAFGLRVDWPSVVDNQLPLGVAVREIVAGSPAAKRGLTTSDRIVAVNGETPATPADFYRLARMPAVELTLQDRKVKLP